MTTPEITSKLRDMAAQILTPSSKGKHFFEEAANHMDYLESRLLEFETGSLGLMWNDSQLGMSLRDWFAGKALSVIEVRKGCVSPDQVASLAYAIADALLVERHKSTVDNL